jgi:hypothetical protein
MQRVCSAPKGVQSYMKTSFIICQKRQLPSEPKMSFSEIIWRRRPSFDDETGGCHPKPAYSHCAVMNPDKYLRFFEI